MYLLGAESDLYHMFSHDGPPSSLKNEEPKAHQTPEAARAKHEDQNQSNAVDQVDQVVVIEETSVPPARGWRFYGAFGTLCLVAFIIALDSTIIAVAIPTIAEDINATAIQAFWCGTSFLLASTVVQPPVASLSHIFGRQSILLICLTIFTVGSIVAAVAKNIATLLLGRTFQGLGSGGILALTYIITTDLVSLRERGKWFGLITLNWAVGTVLGPLIGGALVQRSWPWLFWINLPFCAVAYVMIPVTLTLKRTEGTVGEKLKTFDWIGTIIFVGSLTSFLIPLTWGGIMYDWDSPRTIAPLIVGILGLLAFGFHIMKSSTYSKCDPLIRPSLFMSLTGLSTYFATIIHGMIVWSVLYYVPLYHEVRGSSPLGAGVAVLPFTATVAPAAMIIGLLINKTGLYRPYIWLGWALLPVGTGLMMLFHHDTKTYAWVLICLVGGIGLGVLFSAQSFSAQASSSSADLPFAASMICFFRSLGQGIGVAVGGATFQNAFKKEIEKSDQFASRATEWAKDASALVQVVKRLPPDMNPMKDTIIGGYIQGLETVWMLLCILSCVALVATGLCIKGKSLNRELETDQALVET